MAKNNHCGCWGFPSTVVVCLGCWVLLLLTVAASETKVDDRQQLGDDLWQHPKLQRAPHRFPNQHDRREQQQQGRRRRARVVPDEYIVVFKPDAVTHFRKNDETNANQDDDVYPASDAALMEVQTMALEVLGKYDGPTTQIQMVYPTWAFHGFCAKLSAFALIALLHDDRIEYIEENFLFETSNFQYDPDWGLDRLDQESPQLDHSFAYANSAPNIQIYFLDTGILRTHDEFASSRAICSKDLSNSQFALCIDDTGHGTHVAGLAAGLRYGVAKQALIRMVKVCGPTGYCSLSWVIDGLLHVVGKKNSSNKIVLNMSLQGASSSSFQSALRKAHNKNIVTVLAAGNWDQDACNGYPGNTEPIVVGATNIHDERASFSNYGSCVDVWAPGRNLTSAGTSSRSAAQLLSGTSMSAPLVSGVVAVMMEEDPTLITPNDVKAALYERAIPNVLTNLQEGSPNLLVHLPRNGLTDAPSVVPSAGPSSLPSEGPSTSVAPSEGPSSSASPSTTATPSVSPSDSALPSQPPSEYPTTRPSQEPSAVPSGTPSVFPSGRPSVPPSSLPSAGPSVGPSAVPSGKPSSVPSGSPSSVPSVSSWPSRTPSMVPSKIASSQPSQRPSQLPSLYPTKFPSAEPSVFPSLLPSMQPSVVPTDSAAPSDRPTDEPTKAPVCMNENRSCYFSRTCCPGQACRNRRVRKFFKGVCWWIA